MGLTQRRKKRARPIAGEANRAGWEKDKEIYCRYSGGSNGSFRFGPNAFNSSR